jgi:LacI family transcriptional regulator
VATEAASREDIPLVGVDQVAGASAAVEHLLSLGHRRITYIGESANRSSLLDRLGGFLGALVAGGCPLGGNSVMLLPETDTAGLSRAVDQLLAGESRPSALFCAHDQLAMSLYHLLRERGVSIPEEMSVVGYDNIDAAERFTLPLTTVSQNFYEMGRIAAEILLFRIESGGIDVPYQVHIAPQLIVRQSSVQANRR